MSEGSPSVEPVADVSENVTTLVTHFQKLIAILTEEDEATPEARLNTFDTEWQKAVTAKGKLRFASKKTNKLALSDNLTRENWMTQLALSNFCHPYFMKIKHEMLVDVVGLTWTDIGTDKPKTGTELQNPELVALLQSKKNLTPEEWSDLWLLRQDHYIKVGDNYLRPEQKDISEEKWKECFSNNKTFCLEDAEMDEMPATFRERFLHIVNRFCLNAITIDDKGRTAVYSPALNDKMAKMIEISTEEEEQLEFLQHYFMPIYDIDERLFIQYVGYLADYIRDGKDDGKMRHITDRSAAVYLVFRQLKILQ